MNKMSLEIITAVMSVALFVILIVTSKLTMPGAPGYGYTAALLVFIVMMGMGGLKLAEIPDGT
jgi:hypothetical protein